MTTYDATTDRTTVWIPETRRNRPSMWRALFWIPGRVR